MTDLEIKNAMFDLKICLKYITPEFTIARLNDSYFVNDILKGKRSLIEGEKKLIKFLKSK